MTRPLRLIGLVFFLCFCVAQSNAEIIERRANPTGAPGAGKRVALVIGNSAYRGIPLLINPKNDAADVGKALEDLGFTTIIATELDRSGMNDALDRFSRVVAGAEIALVYYSGHGMQFAGKNYLLPIDTQLVAPEDVNRFRLMPLDDVLDVLQTGQGARVVILDACRNNPVEDDLKRRVASLPNANRNVAQSRGLERMAAPNGLIIAYGTQANSVASDGTARNSPFTEAFLRNVAAPDVDLRQMFFRVQDEVVRQTQGRQLPELQISLVGEFKLNPTPADELLWRGIKDLATPALLDDFLTKFPNSARAAEARTRVAAFERERQAREQAERERLANEQAERQRFERERLTKEQAERERDARERADAQRNAQEQADRDRLARERAEFYRRVQELADREIAKDKAPSAPPVETQTALLPPPSDPSHTTLAVSPPLAGVALIEEIKKELKRVGCFAGRIDGRWDATDVKSSVQNFARYAKLSAVPDEPLMDLLGAVRGKSERVCPLHCDAGHVERNGRCVAKAKTCRGGFVLDDDGNCKRQNDVGRAPSRPVEHRQAVVAPPASELSVVGRANQALKTGKYQRCMGATAGCYERTIGMGRTPAQARAWCSRPATC